jgi:hypothetical protein
MLSKFLASSLVVLILPFTAPLSSCDLTSLFGSIRAQHTPAVPAAPVALTSEAAASCALFQSEAGRAKVLPLSGSPLSESGTRSSSAIVAWSAASAAGIRDQIVQATILRL